MRQKIQNFKLQIKIARPYVPILLEKIRVVLGFISTSSQINKNYNDAFHVDHTCIAHWNGLSYAFLGNLSVIYRLTWALYRHPCGVTSNTSLPVLHIGTVCRTPSWGTWAWYTGWYGRYTDIPVASLRTPPYLYCTLERFVVRLLGEPKRDISAYMGVIKTSLGRHFEHLLTCIAHWNGLSYAFLGNLSVIYRLIWALYRHPCGVTSNTSFFGVKVTTNTPNLSISSSTRGDDEVSCNGGFLIMYTVKE